MQQEPGSALDLDSKRMPARRVAVVGAVVLWAAVVAAGMGVLWRYKTTPGALEAPPPTFPAESALRASPGASAVLVFAHPHCACTRATLAELSALLDRATADHTAYVVITGLAGAEADAERSEAFRLASSISGVRVVADVGGREAALFHARTSGTTVVYDASGRLVFHGGITGARGHVGDNLGRARALAALSRHGAKGSESDVFGCRIDDEEEP